MDGMPPPVVPIQRGFNCIAIVTIGGVKFRVVFDTGAARSLIRTSFAKQLRQSRRTRSATFGPRPLSRPVSIEGVMKGKPSATIAQATQVSMDLQDSLSGAQGKFEVCFAEMDECADALIIGFPDLARFGYSVEEDDDGHIWVSFAKLGVTLLAEVPDAEQSRVC